MFAKMVRYFFSVLFLWSCFFATSLHAQLPSKYAGEFLSLGIGSRYLGMGGASVAIANDVDGSYWNPASTSLVNYLEVSGMYAQGFGGLLNYQQLGFALPLDSNKTLAFNMLRLGVDNIADTRNAWDYDLNRPKENADLLITRFSAADYAFFLNFALSLPLNIKAGASLKVIYRHIGNIAHAWGFGFDLGAIYPLPLGFSVGLSIQDITTTLLAWNNGTLESISPTAKLGVGHRVPHFLWGVLTSAIDMDWHFENRRSNSLLAIGAATMNLNIGIEYVFYRAVAIRVGFSELALSHVENRAAPSVSGKWTIGAGIKIGWASVDYAFAEFANDGLGQTHRISLKVSLETLDFKRIGYTPTPSDNILSRIKHLFEPEQENK